ncbi:MULTISPECIES: type II toxin-antitoxin system RelE/ParE family toxin [Pseudomonas]|jgi:putative addiction module killer protein|uniref:type II toxin-antitoxin system RelE/ParE family toxin n=1 Tax=Pseudomonas TaxID=286 RepID=UPI0004936991|nr:MULTISPECIES: type II toxin-antitoxin system RelE/ParE family toxin [Pseudomonas]MBC3337159.1 type II toxin-antitoxin system RelE/ParE family toxin [Pseudomonas proteolytica]NMY95090.1 type II toxin-antitoxin system RelE/ParE family toxin [Pseudomonas proteolytica]NMY99635.1 type II toxin-antitoxin system RelE/ParE family toxin [Pseudomonas proteolytica]NMZ33411.1 type II toxin-antitoxin system RelE/ParE family toxin [Pseudomonas proteolytica]OHW41269.1 addiction module protein [Pseudomonas
MIEIEEYKRDGQTSPFKQWFLSLSVQARLKVSTSLLRLEMGNTSNIKWFDGMGEYRIDWGPGYRIYLVREGLRLIILFGGGDKSSQKKDIKTAKSLIRDYQRDKKLEQKR